MVAGAIAGPAIYTAVQNLQAEKRHDERDYQQWLRYQEYNTPVNQMARLSEAGLNPNLIYGSGGVSSSTVSVPHFDHHQNNNAEMFMGMLSAYQQILNGQKQRELVDEQIKNLKTKDNINQIKSIGMVLDNLYRNLEIDYKDYEIQHLKNQGTIKGQNSVNGLLDKVEHSVLTPAGLFLGELGASVTEGVRKGLNKSRGYGVKAGSSLRTALKKQLSNYKQVVNKALSNDSIFKYSYDKSTSLLREIFTR